ncbi:MAG: preprotein translocase subunit SecA, partial [Flavobacteriaceae bacterium]|nr:preprotein translocase subunit SecA [Flavobacteriaceae bacterium]
MSFLNSVIKVFVGDKKKKDLKLLQPIVDKVRSFDTAMTALTLDQLREKTAEFKSKIKEATKPFQDKINQLNTEIETANIDRKEEIYKEIDLLKDESYEASEITLNEIQPEAFAVIK